MKKLVVIALFVTSFVSAKSNAKEQNNDENQKSRLEVICCTRSATATVSDGEGNSTTIVRTVTGCSAAAQSMDVLCRGVQREANMKATQALAQLNP